jgi:hypothetical protein
MAFQVGDKVVYPNHGIGVVEDILADSLAASDVRQFYKLRILSNSTVVKGPSETSMESAFASDYREGRRSDSTLEPRSSITELEGQVQG